jgi:hypothetical protein
MPIPIMGANKRRIKLALPKNFIITLFIKTRCDETDDGII